MITKVCGMRQGDNIMQVDELEVDMIGLIFAPKSPRCIETMPDYLPLRAKRVGVFVNESISAILSIAATYNLDYVQLHGTESPSVCRQLKAAGLNVIKAISVAGANDLKRANDYEDCCDYLLFDTRVGTLNGGTGLKFDWRILNEYHLQIPFLLSGGISIDDIQSLTSLKHNQLAGYDLNSRFEIEPGLKDIELLKSFLQNIKSHE